MGGSDVELLTVVELTEKETEISRVFSFIIVDLRNVNLYHTIFGVNSPADF